MSQSPFPPAAEKRSPFPGRALPQAGESLTETALELVFDKFFVLAAVAITIAAVAAVEWVVLWIAGRISPWVWTFWAVVLGGVAAWRWWRLRPQLEALRQGIRGEREVGRMLEELRSLGYVVFHDLPGKGFNVDHVLIGPGGVFAVETKALSMPSGRRAEVDYDGKRVLVDGRELDRDPLAQAQASADHVRDVLKQMTGHAVDVRPVLLFPGWWVNQLQRGGRTWVLNPKVLRSFIAYEPQQLAKEDVALYADRLTIHLSGR